MYTAMTTSFNNYPIQTQTLILAIWFEMVNFTGLDLEILHF